MQVGDGYGGTHTVTSSATTLTVLPALQVTSIALPSSGTDFNTAIDSVQLTFSAPINTATLGVGSLSLTLNGGPNLIATPPTVSLVSGTTSTYQISGLSPLTAGQGTYVLTVNAAAVSDSYGTGLGMATATLAHGLDARRTAPPRPCRRRRTASASP